MASIPHDDTVNADERTERVRRSGGAQCRAEAAGTAAAAAVASMITDCLLSSVVAERSTIVQQVFAHTHTHTHPVTY